MSEATPLVKKLLDAASRNDLPGVKAALAEGADINSTEWGNSALLVAVNRRHQGIADYLIRQGADIEQPDLRGDTPLIRAVGTEYPIMVRMLLGHGAEVNAQNADSRSSVYFAIDDMPTLEVLLEKNPDINLPDNQGRTAIMMAIKKGYLEAVEALLTHNPDFFHADKEGNTAVDYAFDGDHCGKIKVLLEKNGKFAAAVEALERKELNRSLVMRALENDLEGVKTALEKGANIHTRTKNGSAFICAVSNGNTEMAEFLLSKGADIEEKCRQGTPLSIAACGHHAEMIRFLAAKGANPNPRSEEGFTPLYSGCGDVETVKALLKAGTNPDDLGKYPHYIPLIEAIIAGYKDSAKALIAGGAKLELTDKNGNTPLITAAIKKSDDLMEALIEAGADVYDTQRAFDRMDPAIAKTLKLEIMRQEGEGLKKGLNDDMPAPKRIRVNTRGPRP